MLDKITGQLRIFCREFDGQKGKHLSYNACVGSSKNDDNEYLNYYMPVNFSKSVQSAISEQLELEDGAFFDINITDAWIKPYVDKDENVRPILFVNKAKVFTEDEQPKKAPKKATSKK